MDRRQFLTASSILLAAGCRPWPTDGFFNPCLDPALPDALKNHPLVQQAWAGLDPGLVWDSHVHLLGEGDSGSGMWVNPQMRSLFHPVQRIQRTFFLNGACVAEGNAMDAGFLARLLACQAALDKPMRLLLLAFDYHYDESGKRRKDTSAFHIPNRHAAKLVSLYPDKLAWAASVHPYRTDAVAALETAARHGASAVKWLPPAMGMDPASEKCDAYYGALVRLGLPLITHAGEERAVGGSNTQRLGNPLRLRRALEHGVRVIVAHCASLGSGRDLDLGDDGPMVSNFSLFTRLMEERKYQDNLFGDISAVTQTNRSPEVLDTLLTRTDWHLRLINGSDYPLPGILPLFSPKELATRGLLESAQAQLLSVLRQHNPLLFDLALKRALRLNGRGFPPAVFESGRLFFRVAPSLRPSENTRDVW